MNKPCVLISRCILGVPCRYHGKTHRMGHRIGRPGLVARLRKRYTLIDVCPEVDAGLPVPRPQTRIIGDRWICDGEDITQAFALGRLLTLVAAHTHRCHRAYMLRGSPACDPETGMTGKALREQGLTVIRV